MLVDMEALYNEVEVCVKINNSTVDFHFEHKVSHTNQVVDALSRKARLAA